MNNDIVVQLRDSISACGNGCRCQYCGRNKAAADEIERLRAERDTLLKQRFEIDECEENLRIKIESAWRSERDEAIQQRDEAIRERDEARREVCKSEQYCVDRSREEAARRGWDCFKEKTQ